MMSNWNESLKSFFADNVDFSEEKFDAYQDLKSKMEEEINDYWKKITERTKTGEDSYLINTSFEEDLKQMSIRQKYHSRLKKLLGESFYESLQVKIKNYHKNQVEKARNGHDYGPIINF